MFFGISVSNRFTSFHNFVRLGLTKVSQKTTYELHILVGYRISLSALCICISRLISILISCIVCFVHNRIIFH